MNAIEDKKIQAYEKFSVDTTCDEKFTACLHLSETKFQHPNQT
jgi:hypothetical protein